MELIIIFLLISNIFILFSMKLEKEDIINEMKEFQRKILIEEIIEIEKMQNERKK